VAGFETGRAAPLTVGGDDARAFFPAECLLNALEATLADGTARCVELGRVADGMIDVSIRREENGKLIVGLFTDMDNKPKGYLIDRGNFQAFEVPGALSTAGWDINPAGVAVGVFRDGTGFHGFWYDGRNFGSVDVPGATATRVFGINAAGDMVGAYVDSSSRTHGFLAQWTTIQ